MGWAPTAGAAATPQNRAPTGPPATPAGARGNARNPGWGNPQDAQGERQRACGPSRRSNGPGI
eukprot:3153831-Lingulodinium_polyedra.AAC.1